ncbi:ribosomal protein S5 [Desmophyllum pertusum]|uniref:Ribosomal protein S5 n=1 Tax=Desmophyllum pertusum TaxID=174260 RepID=A0A9W9ZAF1_9CNID|nr:ribosomal protein S5 [Desmophyllum pertusum]
MSEDWGAADDTAAPVVVAPEVQDIKLFGKWSTDDVQVSDISLTDYIAVKEKYATYLPHTAGRYASKGLGRLSVPLWNDWLTP